MFLDLLAVLKKTNNLNTETLDMCVGGGAPFSKELIEEVLHTFKLRRFCVRSIFVRINYYNAHLPQISADLCHMDYNKKKSTPGVLRLYLLAYN
jgi:hypothetical protein